MTMMVLVVMVAALSAAHAERPPLAASDVVFVRGPDALTHTPGATDHDLFDQHVVVLCRVTSGGSLTDCKAEPDTSHGEFAPDALRMTATVRVGPRARDGGVTAGRMIRLTFKFGAARARK